MEIILSPHNITVMNLTLVWADMFVIFVMPINLEIFQVYFKFNFLFEMFKPNMQELVIIYKNILYCNYIYNKYYM